MEFDFSNIRYFSDEDFLKILPELRKEKAFRRVVSYMQEGITDSEYEALFDSMTSIFDFQVKFILPILSRVEKESLDGISIDGLDGVDLQKPSVFISNHRNIVLDASLMNLLFYRHQPEAFRSSGVAIGNNLLGEPWIKNLARTNGSFIVERDTNAVAMLRSSQRLSHFIRYALKEDQRNIWIAQREGRAKDGNDQTQPGLLKMLKMAGPNDFAENYAELNIIPVAISYELDPNAAMKVKELHAIEQVGSYTKGPTDDFNSMYMGIVGQKGRMNYHFGKPITLDTLSKLNGDRPINEKIKGLAEHIDAFIHQHYKLYPTAFVAADLLNGQKQFENQYTAEDIDLFQRKWEECAKELGDDNDGYRRIFRKMYANPVKNRFKGDGRYHFDF